MNWNKHNYLMVMGTDCTSAAVFGIQPKTSKAGLTRKIIGIIVFKYLN